MKVKYFLFIVFLLFSRMSFSAETANDITISPVKNNIEIYSGEPGTIEIKLDIPDGQYIYGNPKGPGVGRPTRIEINNPPDFIFEAAKFSAPVKYTSKGDPNFVWIYRDSALIQLPFRTKKTIKPGEYKISISVKALLCSDKSCTPREYNIIYPVKIIFDSSSAIAGNGKEGDTFTYIKKDGELLSAGKNQNKESSSYDISFIKPKFLSVIKISNIIQAIFYGLIAGFILNFMPCVLPVISIKILDIIRFSGEDRKETRKLGIIFAMGILTAFTALAVLAAFLGYSWGSLFQSNTFLIAMIAMVFVLSLSMFEVFTLNVPGFAGASNSITNKYANTFNKGLLATLLATPCSGPFLGGTLAWAFVQPPVVIFIIFISVGLGMSAPYVILTANPRLMKFIPKPGSWMNVFESIMGFLLLGTAIYLIGILKSDLIIPTLWFLAFTGIAFWQYGKFGSLINQKKSRVFSGIAVILIIITGYFFSYKYIYDNKTAVEIRKNSFSISRLFENRNAGKISIVDFTADWCPNCKLVEKTSLYTEEVKDAVNQNNIELLIADLTRENPEADSLLKQLGSRSIPFLAVFPPGESFAEPICLRDIYSKKDVLSAIEMALKEVR